jgi:LacI family transcriptional regulator
LLIGNGYHNEQKERQAIEQLIRHRCARWWFTKMIPDAELIHLMKQIPGMVLINRILPGLKNAVWPWTTATAPGWRPVI